jgi:hypothetical protein
LYAWSLAEVFTGWVIDSIGLRSEVAKFQDRHLTRDDVVLGLPPEIALNFAAQEQAALGVPI